MSTAGTTVFVIDDDASMRRGLERLLRSAGWTVEGYASAHEFLTRQSWSAPGCAILDVRMPGMTGPELHDRMAERGLSLPVIFLTGHGDVPTGIQAMKKGAVDFLLKPVDDEVLLQAIRQAVDWHAGQHATEARHREIQARITQLSPRELEIMKHVIHGKPNKLIAADLGIAEQTVKTHRGRVMEKMRAASVAELVRLCEAAGIG